MKLKLIFFLALLLQGMADAGATIVQKLLLKNGSELEGYISTQRPGKNFTFVAERALIYMAGSEVKSVIDREVNIRQLSPAWIEWGEKNDAFVGVGDNRILLLSDIVTKGNTVSRIRILEKGAKIKYLDMNERSYSLSWDTIAIVRADKRPKTALTGINRVYKLVNGQEYEGQYVEEVPGKTLSLYGDNGVVEVFETDKVVKYSMRKINPDQDLFEQCRLLDVIQLKDGSTMDGVIIEQNFGKTDADNYLLLQTQDGMTRSVKLTDIVEYRKKVNENFKALFDVLLNEGELVINRQQVNVLAVKEVDSFVLLSQDSCLVTIPQEQPVTKIVIETRFVGNMANAGLEIVKVKRIVDKKKKEAYSGFTFEDVVRTDIHPVEVRTTVNRTTRFEYMISEEGLYVIYNPKNKTVIPFRIK